MHRRGENRRSGRQPSLRRGRARRRRDARRRGDRGGRHREHSHHFVRASVLEGGFPRRRRNSGRSLHSARRIRRLQRAAEGRRAQGVRQSPQRSGRIAPAERPKSGGRTSVGFHRPRRRAHRGGVLGRRREAGESKGPLRAFPGMGCARFPLCAARLKLGRRRRIRPRVRRFAIWSHSRHRRRSLQNRLARRTGGLGGHVARAQVGRGLQVSAGGGRDAAARHQGAGGAHGARHPLRRHEARDGRRVDRRAGDASQPLGGRAQGRAHRRRRRRAKGRRRHPRGSRPREGAARRERARVDDAVRLPVVRHRAGPGQGGGRRHPLPQRPLVPGPAG